MKYVAAYLLANLGGKSGSKADITKILESVGAEVDAKTLDSFLKAVDGKTAAEIIATGQEKLAAMPAGGAAPAGAAPAAAAAAPAGGAAAAAAAPAAKEPEPDSEDDADNVAFDLFD